MTAIHHQADYRVMRAREYPDLREYVDAKAKQASDDPVLQADGVRQESEYHNACLAVKLKYQKPIQQGV
jgi:hypothetical protein